MKINKKHLSRGLPDDKVVISSEYYKNDRPSFICSVCNCTLSKLTDSSGQNPTFYCTRCNIEFDPESENVRRESKLSVPDRNVEPAVATTPGIGADSVAIRHEPELKGAFKALRDRGIRITSYRED
jgi:uncharacterized Zn ribbon protein